MKRYRAIRIFSILCLTAYILWLFYCLTGEVSGISSTVQFKGLRALGFLGDERYEDYINEYGFYASEDDYLSSEGDILFDDIKNKLSVFFGAEVFMRKTECDRRILQMLEEIDAFKTILDME